MNEYTPSEARICIDFCNAAVKRPSTDGTFMSMEEADAAFTRWLVEHDRLVAERAWEAGARWGAFVFGNDASVDESRVGLVPPDNPHRKEQENKPDLRQRGSWWHFSSSPR